MQSPDRRVIIHVYNFQITSLPLAGYTVMLNENDQSATLITYSRENVLQSVVKVYVINDCKSQIYEG